MVWLAARQEELPCGESWLAEAERGALSRLRVPKRRGDWLLGRWVAKRALVLTGGAARESDVAILASASGAPDAFVLGRPAGVSLSLTHSHGVAVAALGPAGVLLGVDLEAIEKRPAGFLGDWFTPAEQAFVAEAEAEAVAGEAALAATLVWSAKESVMKALREGLRIPPKAVEISTGRGPADGAWRPFAARGPGQDAWHGWWKAEAGFVLCAVASPASGPPLPIG
ncbi:MAG TPA: 4'-phosphopantetheinyl transferase superfamily protein [Thermoanaerobaculia bacterium]|nr:4'-phosphopantetheinyl transferase superfamily protein [Thermoanaerobaculia bacterium]